MTLEHALLFGEPGRRHVGILHQPAEPARDVGVVIVVGGPQYRVGSHRQFVLLARDLAASGITVLRFDHAGIGDSEGETAGFDRIGGDIARAVDELVARAPHVREVCLLGLCDGASAAVIHAGADPRVGSLVLLNPWVRTEGTLARAYIDNYYGRRFRSPAFWRRMARSPSSLWRALEGYVTNVRKSRTMSSSPARAQSFLDRMLGGAARFRGRILVLLSGSDTVAAEFEGLLSRDGTWGHAFAREGVTIVKLPAANHTFSRREWRDWVSVRTAAFLLGN